MSWNNGRASDGADQIGNDAINTEDKTSNMHHDNGLPNNQDNDISDGVDSVEEEVSRYMETLVRDHLGAAMERYQMQEDASAQQLDDAETLSLIQLVLAAGLEQDRDITLAYLLRAALRVSSDADGANSVVLHRFFHQTWRILKDIGATEVLAFLQAVLEDLLRNQHADEDMPSTGCSSPAERASGIIIFVGNESIEVPFHDVISCFWSTRLDTVCNTCQSPFLDEPPIRTICQHQPKSPTASSICVRITNRHLSCLEATCTFFVPVSHVWDDSIRRANESRSHNDEAAYVLIDCLGALLKGAEDTYESGVEFWHDYFSVPQWEGVVKDSLLLRLPSIYHQAEEILVQFSDLSPADVVLLIIGSSLGTELSLMQALQRIPLLRTLSVSQWMQRMWVTLEYSQSKAACVMDQSSTIWRHRQDRGLFARNTFTKLLNGGQTQLIGLFRHAKSFATSLSLPGEFLGEIASRDRSARQLCLGEAVELVARKQCQVFRDRFLAICVLLNRDISLTGLSSVPERAIDACAWVWRNALTKNDYSPLLLHPREYMSSSNPDAQVPSFLVGCQSLDDIYWGLGNQETPPRRPPTFTKSAIQVEVELVGVMEQIHYLSTEESGEVSGVDWAIGLLNSMANAEGIILSPQGLVEGLNRVFPIDVMHKRAARLVSNMVFSFDELQERDSGFQERLEEQLSSYRSAPSGVLGNPHRRDAAQKISIILQLEEQILVGVFNQITRLTRSRHIARHRASRGSVCGESICEVRCTQCHVATLFRLDLRTTGRKGDKVYRIPGLSYSESVEDGVGLVINGGRITGRMSYGPPACNCQIIERIEIQ
ncbi:hypothetical protein HD806DRAFT_488381 [Xylariaceae sp. AK1471]|nr:hypothetical protein HD806DRAFT_488381 [Xylariaceae sp. AK1471]